MDPHAPTSSRQRHAQLHGTPPSLSQQKTSCVSFFPCLRKQLMNISTRPGWARRAWGRVWKITALPKPLERILRGKMFGRRPNVHVIWRQAQECSGMSSSGMQNLFNEVYYIVYFTFILHSVQKLHLVQLNSRLFRSNATLHSWAWRHITGIFSRHPNNLFFFRKRRSSNFGSECFTISLWTSTWRNYSENIYQITSYQQ